MLAVPRKSRFFEDNAAARLGTAKVAIRMAQRRMQFLESWSCEV